MCFQLREASNHGNYRQGVLLDDELFGSDDIYTMLGPEQCTGKTIDEG